jgi:hypothetical protein
MVFQMFARLLLRWHAPPSGSRILEQVKENVTESLSVRPTIVERSAKIGNL